VQSEAPVNVNTAIDVVPTDAVIEASNTNEQKQNEQNTKLQ
jgi:hypothetical protein